jgi:hypothetical protein
LSYFILLLLYNILKTMEKRIAAKVTNNITILKREMCEEANCSIMCASPSPSELPMPPQKWLKKTPHYDLSLLDWATEQAIEVHWKNQVKACQYAIFHIC